MTDPWSDALEEAYASAPIDEVILHTLELRHTSFASPIRLVRDHGTDLGGGVYGHTLTLEADAPADPSTAVDFVGCMFDFDLPKLEEGQLPELQVSIDGVSAEIQRALDAAIAYRAPLELTYREFLASDTSAPQYVLSGLSIRSVRSTAFRVVASASFQDLVNRSFPSLYYTAEDFKGLRP